VNTKVNTLAALINLLKFSLASRWRKVLAVALLVLVFNLIELGLPKILELYIKAFDGSKMVLFGMDMSFLSSDRGRMLLIPLMLAGLALMRWFVAYVKIYNQGKLGQDVLMDVRRQIYDRVQRFSFDYHDRQHSGTLISNLVEDVRFTTMFFDQAIFLLMESTIFLTTVFIFLLLYSPAAAFTSMGMLFLGLIGAALCFRHAFPIFGRTKELFARMVTLFTENMEGQLVVRAYGRKNSQQDNYRSSVKDLHKSNVREIRWELFANQLIVWSAQLGIPAVIFAYIYSRRSAGLEVLGGDIVLLFATQVLIISKSRQLSRGIELLLRFAITSRRLNEFFTDATEHSDNAAVQKLEKCKSVEFRNVTFAYGERDSVLKNLSFDFNSGTILGIAGTTGAGKSTLVQLICGFYRPESGEIMINGKPVQEISTQLLRENIAIVFQETFLFAGTVRENIAFGTPDAREEDILRAARLSQAEPFINELEKGYETEIGEKGVTLSGGQRQRIGIARALMHKPKLLILDSCTSALDTRTEKTILEELRQLDDTMTVIISHRRSALEVADMLLVLDDGELVEKGAPGEVAVEGSHYMKVMEAVHAG
jgi:ABC-type multidrug transport system fused ATPase/permease subunit